MPTTASRLRIVERVADMRAVAADARRAGRRIGFVPTMGFLHDGHLQLVDEARRAADVVVMSIFVNPLQFGPAEDFERYPRDPVGDAAKAASRGVEVLFTPALDELYPGERGVVVAPLALADHWEGAVRPGHFTGVLTVVAKLFNIVQPDVAIFGQKDIQQATLIRAMVRDLDMPVEIRIAPTVREPDGLALSSRNSYLSGGERQQATVLSRALRAVAAAFDAGDHSAASLERIGLETVATEPGVRLEYLGIVDPERLEPVTSAEPGTVVALAARVGGTRLIDNVILGSR